MKRFVVVCTAYVVALTGTAPLRAQAAPAGADSRRLAPWVGVWQYEGTALATPLGPAARIAGSQTGRLVANGLALEWDGEESGPFGAVKWAEVVTFEPVTKSFAFVGRQSDGTAWSGNGTQEPASWKWAGTLVSKDVAYRMRNETAFSADGNSVRWRSEISIDGKTWLPWTQGTMRRVK